MSGEADLCSSCEMQPHLQALGAVAATGWFISVAASASNFVSVKNRALVSAVQLGLVQATKLLLKAGADPNYMGDLSFTPLHFALMFRARRNADMLELVDLLLISGANVEAGGPI